MYCTSILFVSSDSGSHIATLLASVNGQEPKAATDCVATGQVALMTVAVGAAGHPAKRAVQTVAIFREQPHAKVIVIPNATHFIFLSREEEVISQISDFVNSLSAKR
jgi:alpha/beta superfamily hydrolase